jgi:protein TonB
MRWSMVPVSVAAHGAILVALIINPAVLSDLPTAWPVKAITYVTAAVTPPPLPVFREPTTIATPRLPPVVAPAGIQDDVPRQSTGPASDFAIPSMGVATTSGVTSGFGTPEPTPPPPTPPVPLRSALVRAGGVVHEPKKIVHVPATYPEMARLARIEGVVLVEATIDERGFVTDARVLKSIALLDSAALAALRQWRYTPTLLNGVPVRVLTTITFNFRLGDRVP